MYNKEWYLANHIRRLNEVLKLPNVTKWGKKVIPYLIRSLENNGYKYANKKDVENHLKIYEIKYK